jgi:polyhydroxyalkanoate synthesis repressor PhaR
VVPDMNDQENLAGSSETADAGGDRPEPKVIKRYTNRKLYDTVESRYVTLDEIAQMIKGGAEVKIIDNRSKEDLTSVTLAQIIFEEEKKRSQMPLGVLREIIRHGGDAVAGFYNEKVAQRLNERIGEVRTKADTLRDEVESRLRGVTSMLRRDGKEAPEAAPGQAAPKAGQVKEIITAGVEEIRGRVEAGVKTTLEAAAGSTQVLSNEVDKLQKKLHELEKKIEQLTK